MRVGLLVLLTTLLFAACAMPTPTLSPMTSNREPVMRVIYFFAGSLLLVACQAAGSSTLTATTPQISSIAPEATQTFPAKPTIKPHPLTLTPAATPGAQGNGDSYSPALSDDGRWVAFVSAAGNLIAGDTNGEPDIFVHDRQTGQTERVNVASDGSQANGSSDAPSLSADGRYVAFISWASNLTPGDTNGVTLVHDLQTGKTEPVNCGSSPSLSADGRWVACVYWETGLGLSVRMSDRQTGTIEHVGVVSAQIPDGSPQAGEVSLSRDGRYVAFWSVVSDLVAGDTNGVQDVFVYDRQTGQIEQVSVASDGTQGNNFSTSPSLSADGRWVAFHSHASNLVAGDTEECRIEDHVYNCVDVFVRDRLTGKTERVSVPTTK